MSTNQYFHFGPDFFLDRAREHLSQNDTYQARQDLWSACDIIVKALSELRGLPYNPLSMLNDNVAILAREAQQPRIVDLFNKIQILGEPSSHTPLHPDIASDDLDLVSDFVQLLVELAESGSVAPSDITPSARQLPDDLTDSQKIRIAAITRHDLTQYLAADPDVSVEDVIVELRTPVGGEPYTDINVLYKSPTYTLDPGMLNSFAARNVDHLHQVGAVGFISHSFSDADEYRQVAQLIAQGILPRLVQ